MVRNALGSRIGVIVFSIVLGVVMAALAWVALYAAAVSRRRIRTAVDQPLKALYETIGACGNPPRDQSYNFAVYAIIFTVLAWIVIPLGLWLLFRGDSTAAETITSSIPTTTLG